MIFWVRLNEMSWEDDNDKEKVEPNRKDKRKERREYRRPREERERRIKLPKKGRQNNWPEEDYDAVDILYGKIKRW